MDGAFLEKVRRVGFDVGPKLTGQKKFSTAYVDRLQSEGFRNDSGFSSLACAAVEILYPDLAIDFAEALQNDLFQRGSDPSSSSTVERVADSLGMQPDRIVDALSEDSTRVHALRRAQTAQDALSMLSARGVPALGFWNGALRTWHALDPFRGEKSLNLIQTTIDRWPMMLPEAQLP